MTQTHGCAIRRLQRKVHSTGPESADQFLA